MAKKGYKYTEEELLIKRVNQRLVRLEREGIDSYAKRMLQNRLEKLNAWTGKGRARSSVPEFDSFEKKKFIKALKIFDKAESSRVKEAKRIQKEFKDFYSKIGKTDKKVDFNTAYGITQLASLEMANQFFKKFDPSDVYDAIVEAKEESYDYETFRDKFIANFNVTEDSDARGMLYPFYMEIMGYGY